jgi:hypothetical protein
MAIEGVSMLELLMAIGGLALFLFGAKMISQGMEQLAGGKIQQWADTILTGIIQSSAAAGPPGGSVMARVASSAAGSPWQNLREGMQARLEMPCSHSKEQFTLGAG